MIIELAVVAAAAALSGAFAQLVLKRRAESRAPERSGPELGEPQLDEPQLGKPQLGEPQEPTSHGLALEIGDVIQVAEASRWPRAGLLLTCDGEVLGAVLLSDASGIEEATVVMAPPDEHLYWLMAEDVPLPASPPARLQIDGCLLDRRKLLTVAIEPLGEGAPDVGSSGRFALYLGSVGNAAVVLEANESHVWYGQKLGTDDYERLGQVANRD